MEITFNDLENLLVPANSAHSGVRFGLRIKNAKWYETFSQCHFEEFYQRINYPDQKTCQVRMFKKLFDCNNERSANFAYSLTLHLLIF